MPFGGVDPEKQKRVQDGVEGDGELVGAGDFPEPFLADSLVEHQGKLFQHIVVSFPHLVVQAGLEVVARSPASYNFV